MLFTYTSAIHNRVFTVTDQSVLLTGDPSQWNFNARSQINPKTNFTFMDGKHFTYLFLKGIKLRIKLYFQKYKKITALNVFFFRGPLHAFKVHELQYGHKVCCLHPKHSMLCCLFYAYHSFRPQNT